MTDAIMTNKDKLVDWTMETFLPSILSESQAIVTKNRVYLLGGWNGGAVSTVYTTYITTKGTFGEWTVGASLPSPLYGTQAVVTKNRVYLLGGYDGSVAVPTVYTAPIGSDGMLGEWTTGSSLPGALTASQAIVTKNRLYLLGGYNGRSTVAKVYTAPIDTDGTVGEWSIGTSLPGPLDASQAIVTKNRVYLLGGVCGTVTSKVYTAPINRNGILGTWALGTSLPDTLAWSRVVMLENRVYLLGGWNGSRCVSTVRTAPIDTDGTLGAWSTDTPLPRAAAQLQVVVTKTKRYLLCGYTHK